MTSLCCPSHSIHSDNAISINTFTYEKFVNHCPNPDPSPFPSDPLPPFPRPLPSPYPPHPIPSPIPITPSPFSLSLSPLPSPLNPSLPRSLPHSLPSPSPPLPSPLPIPLPSPPLTPPPPLLVRTGGGCKPKSQISNFATYLYLFWPNLWTRLQRVTQGEGFTAVLRRVRIREISCRAPY